MALQSGDRLPQTLERDATAFFQNLHPVDQTNIAALTGALSETAVHRGLHGAIIGVGGVLTKPAPRKDIDCVVLFYDTLGPLYNDAVKVFKTFEALVHQVSKHGGFKVVNTLAPEENIEMGIPGMTRKDGNIELKPREGIAIDLIPRHTNGLDHFKSREHEPYAVLKTF